MNIESIFNVCSKTDARFPQFYLLSLAIGNLSYDFRCRIDGFCFIPSKTM